MLSFDLSLFLGRFHPLLVHLPIGFLLLAAVLEWWPGQRMHRAARLSWGLGAGSAVAAAALGWLLASGGDYGGSALFWHRWLGLGVAGLAVVGWWLGRRSRPVNRYFAGITVLLLALAGHQGGNLTHGETYLLDHAPAFVRTAAGYGAADIRRDLANVNPDSLSLYADLIRPVLEDRCVRCHNAEKQNGDLRLDSYAHLLAGGKTGPLYVAGNAGGSEWVRRLTLPPDHPKHMPPNGSPVSYVDLQLVRHWIETGADSSAILTSEVANPDPELQALLLRDYGIDLRPRPFAEKLRLPQLSPEERTELESAGWLVVAFANGALDVSVPAGRTLEPRAINQLAQRVGARVVYLDLGKQRIGNEQYASLAKLSNLNRLNLDATDLTDGDLAHLSGLTHLESLNLYATAVTDAGLAYLQDLPALRSLYLWRTDVTADGIRTLAAHHPDLDINVGYEASSSSESTPSR